MNKKSNKSIQIRAWSLDTWRGFKKNMWAMTPAGHGAWGVNGIGKWRLVIGIVFFFGPQGI